MSEYQATPFSQIEGTIDTNDTVTARELILQFPEVLRNATHANMLVRLAARKNKVDMLAVLVSSGVDVNIPKDAGSPEGPILDAAREGAVDAVRWLLDHGATINHQVDGVTRCLPLAGAARKGNMDVVKLLVEHGAEINAKWGEQTPLSFAQMYNQPGVAAYLRSKGAVEPS